MQVLGPVLFGVGLWISWLAVPLGVGLGGWLLLRRHVPLLAGAPVVGAALVVLAWVRQHDRDARVDGSGGVGGWDPAFLPLCLLGVALVAVGQWAAAAGPRVRTD